MPHYKVELISIDREYELRDIQFFTFVEANDQDDAIYKAKAIQRLERPDINIADTWCWCICEEGDCGQKIEQK